MRTLHCRCGEPVTFEPKSEFERLCSDVVCKVCRALKQANNWSFTDLVKHWTKEPADA